MYALNTTVTLFLRGRAIERKYLLLLLFCLMLLCAALVLIHQGGLHPLHGVFADGGTPWDGGDVTGS
jgi:hypothetical protein